MSWEDGLADEIKYWEWELSTPSETWRIRGEHQVRKELGKMLEDTAKRLGVYNGII